MLDCETWANRQTHPFCITPWFCRLQQVLSTIPTWVWRWWSRVRCWNEGRRRRILLLLCTEEYRTWRTTTASLLSCTHFCICVPTLYRSVSTDGSCLHLGTCPLTVEQQSKKECSFCPFVLSLVLPTAGTRSSETTSRKRTTTSTPSLLPVMQSWSVGDSILAGGRC